MILVAWKTFNLSFATVFLIAGLLTLVVLAFLVIAFPQFREGVPQRKKLVLRKRYWLYYALTFMGGARRQIFTVFAGFLMVERFGYDVHEVAGLFLLNGAINMLLAPKIGSWIGKVGEKTALTVEYVGLIGVFVTYAFVTNANLAAALYVIDHAFFAVAIAMKTYFQKISDPADIAPTSGVAFTINHIAAVFIPALFGLIWLVSPAAVFLIGAAMACVSLVLARLVPTIRMRATRWCSSGAAPRRPRRSRRRQEPQGISKSRTGACGKPCKRPIVFRKAIARLHLTKNAPSRNQTLDSTQAEISRSTASAAAFIAATASVTLVLFAGTSVRKMRVALVRPLRSLTRRTIISTTARSCPSMRNSKARRSLCNW